MFNEEASRKVMDNLAKFFIHPEIERRKTAGLIDDSFDLVAAQLIQYPDGRPSEIRLNSEVLAMGKPKYKDGVSKMPGDLVYAHEIEDVEWIGLTDEDDPDCSHVTFMKIGGTWHVHLDFRLNKDLAIKHLHSANQFFSVAESCLEKKHWAPFLDNLFSSAELAIKSTQLTFSDKKFRKKTTHQEIKNKYNQWADLGNALPAHKEAYNKLYGYRARARYSEPDFSIPDHEADEMLNAVKEMIETAHQRVQT